MSRGRNRPPSFWSIQIFGWIIFGIISIPVKWTLFGTLSGAMVSLYREVLGFLLTSGMYLVYRRIYGRWEVAAILMAILFLSFMSSATEVVISFAVHNVVVFDEAGFHNDATRMGVLYYRAAILASWSFLYFGLRLYYEAKDLSERLAQAVAENRDAEAQQLRALMTPHFIFNALATIRGSIDRSQEEFRRVIQSLADYLVYALDSGMDRLVTLGMEFDATCNYLQVEKSRFQEGIEIATHIDAAARRAKVPGIILQPLVENAVKYGWKTSERPVRVNLSVTQVGRDTIRIVVRNSGHWVESQEEEKTSHLGLSGVRRRLELLYADRHRVDVSPGDDWVTITIDISVL